MIRRADFLFSIPNEKMQYKMCHKYEKSVDEKRLTMLNLRLRPAEPYFPIARRYNLRNLFKTRSIRFLSRTESRARHLRKTKSPRTVIPFRKRVFQVPEYLKVKKWFQKRDRSKNRNTRYYRRENRRVNCNLRNYSTTVWIWNESLNTYTRPDSSLLNVVVAAYKMYPAAHIDRNYG